MIGGTHIYLINLKFLLMLADIDIDVTSEETGVCTKQYPRKAFLKW